MTEDITGGGYESSARVKLFDLKGRRKGEKVGGCGQHANAKE